MPNDNEVWEVILDYLDGWVQNGTEPEVAVRAWYYDDCLCPLGYAFDVVGLDQCLSEYPEDEGLITSAQGSLVEETIIAAIEAEHGPTDRSSRESRRISVRTAMDDLVWDFDNPGGLACTEAGTEARERVKAIVRHRRAMLGHSQP